MQPRIFNVINCVGNLRPSSSCFVQCIFLLFVTHHVIPLGRQHHQSAGKGVRDTCWGRADNGMKA